MGFGSITGSIGGAIGGITGGITGGIGSLPELMPLPSKGGGLFGSIGGGGIIGNPVRALPVRGLPTPSLPSNPISEIIQDVVAPTPEDIPINNEELPVEKTVTENKQNLGIYAGIAIIFLVLILSKK